MSEEIGDLLHSAISLCLFAGFDVEQTLSKSAAKLDARIKELKKLTLQQDLSNLEGQSIEFKLGLWREAKKLAKT